MGILRPATPGFIVTLVATILLAVVSFCVPYFKSVYFLKATVEAQGKTGAITFGTLGYCIEIGSTFNCSKPSVGYELDINSLVGNKLPVKIPQVAVKWLTYCLVLHIVALGLSAGSAVFGLLAHVRDFSMTCCSTCVSGFAAAVALLAFIFDIAIFFAAKSRINAVGSASLGNATWLTLAAWLLLFFSGCFFTIGRCCISRRPGGNKWGGPAKGAEDAENFQSEQLRLNAIKAENDRKAKQNRPEGGLPTFHSEYQPLTGHEETDPYRDPHANSQPAFGGRPNANGGYSGGGYAPGQAGNRTVDDYYTSPTREYPPTTNAHSTQPQPNTGGGGYGPAAVAGAAAVGAAAGAGYAQYSGHQSPRRQQSNYAPSTYSTSTYAPNLTSSPPPQNQYLAPIPQGYGHTSGGSSYHTAQGSHEQQPTNYSAYDPYQAQQSYAEPNYTSSPPMPNASNYGGTSSYFPNVAPQSSTPPQPTPERSYTLGGHNYDQAPNPYTAASTPATATHESTYYTPTSDIAPTPINTGYQSRSGPTSPVKGQPHGGLMVRNESPQDAPPTYDAGTSNIQGNWGKS